MADAFEHFVQALTVVAPAHVRITRAASVEERVLLTPRLVDLLGEPELVAAAIGGEHVQRGTFAGCVAIERVRLRGYELGLFTGRDLLQCSFRSLDTPACSVTHGLLVDAPDDDRCIAVPTTVLRYLLEGWVEEFLAATRFAFMPDLAYFVRGRWSGEDEFLRSIPADVHQHVRPAGNTPPPIITDYLIARLGGRAQADAVPLAEFDAQEARAAAFPDELRAAGLADDEVAFLLESHITPEFLDDALAAGTWATVQEFVASLREQRAAHDAAFGDLDALLDPTSWCDDDEAN